MKTIEISSKTDAHRHLRIESQFGKPQKNVRVLIMLADEVEDEMILKDGGVQYGNP